MDLPDRYLTPAGAAAGGVRRTLGTWVLPGRGMRRSPWPVALGLLYLAVIGAVGDVRWHHAFLASLGLLDLYNQRSRSFLRAFLPFILTGVIFDGMRYFYWPVIEGRVHVAEPYLLERTWFGVGGRTLNEVFLEHHWPALDLAAGFAYLVYVGEYIALAFVLFLRRRIDGARTFALCFLVVNVMGFATYFAYPVAPPWYVTLYGLGPVQLPVAPHPAATLRVDAFLGVHLFEQLYGQEVVVFGAYPSLHVSYPVLAVLLALRFPELRWARVPAALFLLLMCLSAVYLQHHYVVDVLLGIAYGVVALAAVTGVQRWAAARRRPGERPGAGGGRSTAPRAWR